MLHLLLPMCAWCFLHVEDGMRYWSLTFAPAFAFFFSSRRRHTRLVSDWSSDVCSSDLLFHVPGLNIELRQVDVQPGNVKQRSLEPGEHASQARQVGERSRGGQPGAAGVDRKSVV